MHCCGELVKERRAVIPFRCMAAEERPPEQKGRYEEAIMLERMYQVTRKCRLEQAGRMPDPQRYGMKAPRVKRPGEPSPARVWPPALCPASYPPAPGFGQAP